MAFEISWKGRDVYFEACDLSQPPNGFIGWEDPDFQLVRARFTAPAVLFELDNSGASYRLHRTDNGRVLVYPSVLGALRVYYSVPDGYSDLDLSTLIAKMAAPAEETNDRANAGDR